MREVKLSAKNQIVIPREIRHALGVKAGDRLLVVPRRDTVILLSKPSVTRRPLQAWARNFMDPATTLPRREKAGSRHHHPAAISK
jgi:AbrB family looped-hinge helix DNA binding protein